MSKPRQPTTESEVERPSFWQRPVLRRAAIASVGVALVALLNSSFVGWSIAVAAMVTLVPARRYRALATAFVPYGAAWLIFTVLRALADETPIRLRTEQVTDIERAISFGYIPTMWLQERLFDINHIAWYDYATTFVHWSYFFVPHLVAFLIWRRDPWIYQRYLLTTILTLGLGLVIYFMAPAAPPWLTADAAPQQDIYRVMANVGQSLNSSLYDRTYSVIGDSNPVAAMPSLHMAITFILVFFGFVYSRWLGIAAFLYSVAMAFALIYTGEHYLIDVLVGCGIASYAYAFASRWLNWAVPMLRAPWARGAPSASSASVSSGVDKQSG